MADDVWSQASKLSATPSPTPEPDVWSQAVDVLRPAPSPTPTQKDDVWGKAYATLAAPSDLPTPEVTGSEGRSLGRALAIGGATGVRIASGLATVPLEGLDVIPPGLAARAGIGAVLGGGADLAAQGIENLGGVRQGFSLPEAGVAAGLQAIPLGEFANIGKAARTGIRALQGAGLGVAGQQATSLLETGEPASLGDTAQGAVIGGAFGFTGEAIANALRRQPKVVPPVAVPAEMPGPTGFTAADVRGAPVPLPEEPIPPTFQPLQPNEPIPYGPPAQAYEQPATPDGSIEPTAMWPLSGQVSVTGKPVTEPQAQPPPVTPTLRTNEQGTGEMFQGADQPFNLAGQVDPNLRTAAEEAAAKAEIADKAKAAAQAEKDQLNLLGVEMSPEEEAQMQQEYYNDLLANVEAHQARGGDEFLDFLKKHGLPTKWHPKEGPYTGELQRLRDMFESLKSRGKKGKLRYGKGNLISNTGEKVKYNEIFRENATGGMDSLLAEARSKGYPVDGIADLENLIQDRLLNGKKVYGNEAAAEESQAQSFGRGRIDRFGNEGAVPQPSKSRVMRPGAIEGTGRFWEVYEINKEAGDKVNALAGARESASLLAKTMWRKVVGDLTPQQQTNLGQYLVSERLKEVNPDHPQILSAMETAQITRDAEIARALNRYKREVKPEIESLRMKAGLSEAAASGKSRQFISLIPTTDELLASVNMPVGGVSLRFRSKTTGYAAHALGMAKEYDTNLKNILDASYTEVTKKARLRELYDLLVDKGLVSEDPVKEIYGSPAEAIDLGAAKRGANQSALPDKAFMPGPIAAAINDVMTTPPQIKSKGAEIVKGLQSAITGTSLTANPLEVVNHMRRQFDVVATMPAGGVPVAQRMAEAVVPYFGPRLGLAIRALTNNMSTAENRAILQDLFNANAGSTRAFEEYQAKNRFAKAVGIQKLQATTQNLLFGLPEGRGVQGFDLRMRVQLEKIRRAIEGNVDPQRMRDFSQQIGQYTSKPDKYIEIWRKVNPYSATTLPMRGAELRQLFGTSGLKADSTAGALGLRAETFLRGAGGTVITLIVANKLLSGHYPWQNAPGHETDLELPYQDANGKPIYLKNRVIAPTFNRAIATVSLPEFMREARSPTTEKSYAMAGITGPANQLLSIASSPLSNVAFGISTGGHAPYITRQPGQSPEFYDMVGTHGITGDRGLDGILASILGVHPLGRVLESSADQFPEPLNYVQKYGPFGNAFTTSYEKGGKAGQPKTYSQQKAQERTRAQRAMRKHK